MNNAKANILQGDFFNSNKKAFYAFDKPSKAIKFFSDRYFVPVISQPDQILNLDVVYFSLTTWRDYYLLAELQKYRTGKIFIAGGNACENPTGLMNLVDYIFIGDAYECFRDIHNGNYSIDGMMDTHNPKMVKSHKERIPNYPISPSEIILSRGCKRKCLFCVNAYRQDYEEAVKTDILDFINNRKGKGVALSSNSYNDVSYMPDIEHSLEQHGMVNTVVSNSFDGLTDSFVANRKTEILLGIEGLSARIRKIINKPIPQKEYRDKIIDLLRQKKNIRTVYQFNMPTETMVDLDEMISDVEYITSAVGFGSWAIPFIPNQPSPMTPLQWATPYYNFATAERLMSFRKRFSMGNKMNGVSLIIPAPLYPKKWFMQVFAEWMPVDEKALKAFDCMPEKQSVEYMVGWLYDIYDIDCRHILRNKNKDFVFPWDELVQYNTPKDKLFAIYSAKVTHYE